MQTLEQITETVLAHPLHSACELDLVEAGNGAAVLTFAVNDFSTNPQGALHGGILYALMDVACFFAVMTRLSEDQHPVSVEVHTSVLRAARAGETVRMEARLDRLGRTLAASRCEAYAQGSTGEPRLIATGSVTKAIVTSAND